MDIQNFKPLNDRILVRVAKTPSRVGSLYVPETKRTLEAKILKLPDNCLKGLEEGARVIYDYHAGIRPWPDHEDYLLLREDDIFAIIEED